MPYGTMFGINHHSDSYSRSRYCVEIPRAGERVFEGGDIALLESLKQSNNEGKPLVDKGFVCLTTQISSSNRGIYKTGQTAVP